MTKQENISVPVAPSGLALLRQPFPDSAISKLPKPTAAQTTAVKNDFTKGIRCEICGQWHHPKVVHLDYVGHAALTDRLLEADPTWNWEPASFDEIGLPRMDAIGGMWIKLTVCGVTRLGYGDAQGKKGPNAVKELIGDALRNAAMRFGAALDLWHKGDLHGAQDDEPIEQGSETEAEDHPRKPPAELLEAVKGAANLESLVTIWKANREWQTDTDFLRAKDVRKAELEKQQTVNADLAGDEIPY